MPERSPLQGKEGRARKEEGLCHSLASGESLCSSTSVPFPVRWAYRNDHTPWTLGKEERDACLGKALCIRTALPSRQENCSLPGTYVRCSSKSFTLTAWLSTHTILEELLFTCRILGYIPIALIYASGDQVMKKGSFIVCPSVCLFVCLFMPLDI